MSHGDTLFDADAWRGRMDERWFESGAHGRGRQGRPGGHRGRRRHRPRDRQRRRPLCRQPARPDGEGACTCPGFDKFGACKHQAAVVVAANLLDGTGRGYVRDRLARLRDGLALESKDALIERIVDLAKKDPQGAGGAGGVGADGGSGVAAETPDTLP
jgi:hypothetical protein